MIRTALSLPVIAVLALLQTAACSSSKNTTASRSASGSTATANAGDTATPRPQKEPQEKGPAPVMTFEKTPCFGSCPIYKARIYADGKVKFDGVRNTKMVGPYEFTLAQDTLQALLDKAQRLNFFQLDSTYIPGATDLPSTIMTLNLNGKKHKIRSEGSGPDALENYFRQTHFLLQRQAKYAKPREDK